MNVVGSFRPSKCKWHLEITLGKMLQPNASSELDKSMPYIRAANVHWGRVDRSDLKEMWFSPSEIGKYTLRNKDLVVLEGGDVGRCAILEGAPQELGFQNSIHRVRARKGIEIRFVYYWMKHLKSLGYIDLICSKATLAHFTGEKFAETPFPVIDFVSQQAIADFLDRETARIDRLIEKRSKFAELVIERRLAIVAKAITGMTGGTPWLEILSDGWSAERAKVHFRESQQRSEAGQEELLTVSHITGVTKRSEKDVNMFKAESNEGYKLVAPGDLVINTMWAWMGAIGVSSEHGLVSPSYGVYTPISDALRSEFVDLMVRSKPFVAEATRRSKGIHSSRLRLYPDAFLDMRLPIPPRKTQDTLLREVTSRMQRENELLQKNERAEALLREFRSALITAAVTGQIDVATWRKQGCTERHLDQVGEEEISA